MAADGPGLFSRLGKRISERWMLGGLLTDLDVWPPTGEPQPAPSITIDRLNWSVQWYTLANRQAMRWYTSLKAIQILAAAAIPVLTATGGSSSTTKGLIAGLGALIVVLEGIQQLKKYAQNGLLWGQGKEALKREYFLYRAEVKPYDQADRQQILASRIEQIIGREVAKWPDRDQGGQEGHEGKPRRPRAPTTQ
jgi:uncharacterized protein DUF4231